MPPAPHNKRLHDNCAICRVSKRPVGLVVHDPRGFGVLRWGQAAPFVTGLATKSDAFVVLWGLKHGWSTVKVRFTGRELAVLDLTPMPPGDVV